MDISSNLPATVQNFVGNTTAVDRNKQASSDTSTAVTPKTATGLNALPVVNPASHIDPALGIVVVETYSTAGEVVEQYPTAHMMQQYSLYGLSSK